MSLQEKPDSTVNKRKNLEKQIEAATGFFEGDIKTHTLLESLAEGVIVIDKSERILLINESAERILGYSKNEILGKNHDIILPLRYHSIHKKHMIDYFKEPRNRPMGMGLDLVGLRKDGSEIPVEISLSFFETADNFFVLAFISDITLRKKIEQELKDRNKSLDAFAHTLAHDIKNSIAIITGFSKYVNDSIDDISKEEIVDSLKRIETTGNKVNHIISGLLRFSTLGKESISLTPVQMRPLILSVLDRLQNVIHETKATINIDGQLPDALGYDSWVEEIWLNYISNAIRYGGSPPVVSISGDINNDGYIHFYVHDNGKGIPPERIQDIFESYESRKEKSEKGYGLGLSIVKRITEKLGGIVGIRSKLNEGSTFFFTLKQIP